MCLMCRIRTTLKKAMDEIDALPEVNSALYDDTVAEAYQALETAYYMHQHSCDENAEQNAHLTLGSHTVFCVCCGGEVTHPVCVDCLPSPAQVA